MRRLKFRAWGGEGKKYYVYFSLFSQSEEEFVKSDTADADGGRRTHYKHLIDDVEQFTGLNDKSGKPIFEGDVVKWKQPHDEVDDRTYTDEVTDVTYGEGAFYPIGSPYCQGPYEVIGNVHQHPELLTPKP